MTSAANMGELQELHKLIAKSLTGRIQKDMEDGFPTDAATLGAAIKFLQNNNVTADPADADDLKDLRNKLTEQAAARKAARARVVQLVQSDLKTANGE